jgi:hypothetical protein
MAACEKNLHRYTRVLSHVDKYLETGNDFLSEADRKEARAFRDAVRGLVSELTIDVDQAGANVTVDDAPAGTTPLHAPVLVDAGVRKIRVAKPGFKEATQNEQIPGGAPVRVHFALVRDAKDAHLRVVAREGDEIAIDGRAVGLARWSGSVESGSHVVVVSASGKKQRKVEVALREEETRTLDIELERDKSGGVAWPWFVAGGALLAGAAVGGYFLFRPSSAPAPTQGNAGGFQLP